MSRSRGRRYDTEPKLNIKKVIAVIIALAVIIMFILIIKGVFQPKDNTTNKISSKSYFSAFKDDKWGVIDQNGEIVIEPSYQEMIIIPNPKIDVFLCTYDVNYETGEYKTKALNSENKEIFTQYENIEALENKDANNLWYEENILKIKQNDKFGAIDLEGKEILPLEYEEITPIIGIKNALKIKKDGKWGIAGNDGKIVIEPKYSEITNLGKDNISGYIVQDETRKYGIVDYSSNVVLECKYDKISNVYGNDLYVVTENNKQKLVNKSGETVLETGFDEITEILKNKETGVIFKQNNKYGIMKTTGEIVLQPEYEELKEAKTGILIAKRAGKYGVIDMTKAEKIPFNYNSISYNEKADIYIADDENFNSTLFNSNFEAKITGILTDVDTDAGYIKIVVGDDTRFYNFRFEEKSDKDILTTNTLFLSKKDGKFGFVDKDGNVVVDYIYDDATEQNQYGYAGVKKDGKWGSIDSKGNVVQEPVYELDDYLLVDFIGRWHLGKDLNSNYYNKE